MSIVLSAKIVHNINFEFPQDVERMGDKNLVNWLRWAGDTIHEGIASNISGPILNVVTGRLMRSLRTEVNPSTLTAEVSIGGGTAWYAMLHEYGGELPRDYPTGLYEKLVRVTKKTDPITGVNEYRTISPSAPRRYRERKYFGSVFDSKIEDLLKGLYKVVTTNWVKKSKW